MSNNNRRGQNYRPRHKVAADNVKSDDVLVDLEQEKEDLVNDLEETEVEDVLIEEDSKVDTEVYNENQNQPHNDEFYLLTEEEISEFNDEMSRVSNNSSKIGENKKEEIEIDKKIEKIKEENVVKKEKVELFKKELNRVEEDIVKHGVESEIYGMLINIEINPSKINDLIRKKDNHDKNIEHFIQRKNAILEILKKYE